MITDPVIKACGYDNGVPEVNDGVRGVLARFAEQFLRAGGTITMSDWVQWTTATRAAFISAVKGICSIEIDEPTEEEMTETAMQEMEYLMKERYEGAEVKLGNR